MPAAQDRSSRPNRATPLRGYVQANRLAATMLGLAIVSLAILLTQSLAQLFTGNAPPGFGRAFIGGMAAFGATALGALIALGLRSISQKLEDSMLGMAAGMMLAASAFSLILPGIEAGTALFGSKASGAAIVVLGMALGVMLMLGLDRFTPHMHETTGQCGPESARCTRVWLFVFAIALHNLPEGMAIGVSFAHNDLSVGLPTTIAIALQDLPEGLAVALALRTIDLSAGRAALLGAASGLVEPLGALLGVGLSSGLEAAYPTGLGLAAGAMIFVVSHEVIPETHRNGHQTPATIGLVAGFALMMVMDTVLG